MDETTATAVTEILTAATATAVTETLTTATATAVTEILTTATSTAVTEILTTATATAVTETLTTATATAVPKTLTTATAFTETLTTTTAITETLTTLSLHASSPLPALPFELVAEILCRLPVKLLLQLRCLCKSFATLISDPKFIRKHLRMSTACHRLLLISSGRESHVLSYPLHSNFITVTDNPIPDQYPVSFEDQWYYNFGSCDGMFCVEVNRTVFLWNPSIKKSYTLPFLGGYHSYGFGFDTLIHNYKVVSVRRNMDNQGILEDTKIRVHTLGTNSWRIIPGEFPDPVSKSLKLASGALNWFASNDYSIVSFDLVNESYRKFLAPNYGRNFSAPNYGEETEFGVILDVLRDCLCIAAHSHTFSSVWMMKEYGNEESWTKLFRVPRNEGYIYDILIEPIWIFEDDQVLMKNNKDLVLCDFKNNAFKIKKTQNIHSFTPKVYIESLVSPCF